MTLIVRRLINSLTVSVYLINKLLKKKVCWQQISLYIKANQRGSVLKSQAWLASQENIYDLNHSLFPNSGIRIIGSGSITV